ncbi:MAG: SMP-30/gluconolactonase/LRE family protein [Caulobacteraceae bacterium]|nr:SMP-30/gluconolactonase/LRE family protein [Caulobacteraceae bacterium]
MTPKLVLDGLVFGEAPRWRAGRLWFSDMHGGAVYATTVDGVCEKILDVPHHPSGLGWLPNGALLVVSMEDRKVLRLQGGEVSVHADLMGHYARGHLNDMVVDGQGRAYLGQFGSDTYGGEPQRPTTLILIEPDGRHRAVADGLRMPNGMAISPDGRRLYVAETYGFCITGFSIAADGGLSGREVFAPLKVRPDGLCLDAEERLWFGSAMYPEGGVFRVAQGGRILESIREEGWRGIACALGGEDRRILFVIEAQRTAPGKTGPGNCRIRAMSAPAPGAGIP